MNFRRAVQRYGRTPEPVTPYQRAAQVWDERIDSAMATFLKYLPANPLVIEGYATAGPVGERFQRSRTRAGAVRDYVMSQYALRPQHTGSIALADEATGSPTDDRWDGVAVTLFLDRDELQFTVLR